MRRSGVRIPLAPPQADIRSGCRFFVCLGALVWCLSLCCLWRRWCSGRSVVMLCGALPLCVPVGGGPPARSPHASLTARSGRSRGPPWPCRRPPAPRPGPAGLAAASNRSRCLYVARPGPATAHGHRSQVLRSLWRLPRRRRVRCCTWWRVGSKPGRTAVAGGDSRETVNTFAGVCSVSGETDDTIASQRHRFLVLFHRAKASWVSYRRPDVPALVLTVTCCGAVSSMGATKFARRGLLVTIARKYAPSAGRMAQNERFIAGWASVFASVGGGCLLGDLYRSPAPSSGHEALHRH